MPLQHRFGISTGSWTPQSGNIARISSGDVVVALIQGAVAVKERPAVVVSSAAYHRSRPDVIVGIVTYHAEPAR